MPFPTGATRIANPWVDSLRGPTSALPSGQAFNRTGPKARYPHETGYKSTRPTSPSYSFGRPSFGQTSRPQPNLVAPFAATDQFATTKGSLATASSGKSTGPKRHPSGIKAPFRPPITNFSNVHTPTAPSAYAPSFYPFPLGRHKWSSRCL